MATNLTIAPDSTPHPRTAPRAMQSHATLPHKQRPHEGHSQPLTSDIRPQRPMSPCPTMTTQSSSSFERPRGFTTHHRRQESSVAYTSNTCGSLSSSKSMDSIKRSAVVYESASPSPKAITASMSASPVMTSSPLFSAQSSSSPTTTSSRSIYWPVQNDDSPTRSLRSTDAIKSPCASPQSTAHSQSVVSSLLRRSSSKDMRMTVHSHRSSVNSASSNQTGHSTAGRRISDPIFQAASNGMEPHVLTEQDSKSSLSASRSNTLDDTTTSAGTVARRRLLSTAYEESEVQADMPTTPRHNRVASSELKSKFSHSPTPHKTARSKETEANAFNRSLAALRKSLSDTGRPDLGTLEHAHVRSESPLPPPPSKGRKMLGFLSSGSRSSSPLPLDPGRRSSCGTQSSVEEKRVLRLSLKQRSKSKLRLGSKQPADSSRPGSPLPPRAQPSPPPPLPVRSEVLASARQPTSQPNMELPSLPVPGHRQHTSSHLTVSSRNSQSSKGTSNEGKGKASDYKSHSPRKPRSLRSFRLIPRSSPKKRPSRPPLTAIASQPVIRDSWVDLSEDVQLDGSSAVNGFPTPAAFEQKRGGIMTGKRKRTWNLASKPAQSLPWEFHPKLAPYCLPESTPADQLRIRKQSIVAETAPRLPSLVLGRMTPIGERSVDRLVSEEADAEQENRPLTAGQDGARPKSPPKRLFMLPSAGAPGSKWEGRPRPMATASGTGSIQAQPRAALPTPARNPNARPRLHLKPNRFDVGSIPAVSTSIMADGEGSGTKAAAQPAAELQGRAPRDPLPELPSTLRQVSNTLPVPAALPQTRSGSMTSAGSSAVPSGPQSRRSVDPDNGDPTQMTMSTVGTSILFSDVDMALRRWTAQQRGRLGSDVSRGLDEGYCTPAKAGVPSEQEIQLAAALARYICNQSDSSRSKERTSLCERLIEMLGNGQRPSSARRGPAPNGDECNLSHATEATDILSELVAQFKPTPLPSPGGPKLRRGSNSSISSSRLLRTPERQQHRLRSHGSRSGSTTTSLYRGALHSPSSRRSPGRSSILSRRHIRSNRSREGSIATHRTYSQSIMSYCSTPVSSSADDLTSLLEGLLETSEGESNEERGAQRRVPQPKWEVGSLAHSCAEPTVVPCERSPQTPVASTSKRREAPNTGTTSRLNSEAIAAVLELYQPGNTPARGSKRKEPDLQQTIVSSSGPRGSPQTRRSGSIGGGSRMRSRRISIEQGLRRLQLKEARQGGGTAMPQAQPDAQGYSSSTATSTVQHDMIVAHMQVPDAPLPMHLNPYLKDVFRNTSSKGTEQFPPTPPLSVDRRGDKFQSPNRATRMIATTKKPSTQLFSPVPALVITDADVEAKCKSLADDDPFGSISVRAIHKKTPSSSSSSRKPAAAAAPIRRLRHKRSIDSLDNYHTAPGSDSELGISDDVGVPPPLPMRLDRQQGQHHVDDTSLLGTGGVLPPLEKPEWEGESD